MMLCCSFQVMERFLCQPVEVILKQGDDTASNDAGPFGLEEIWLVTLYVTVYTDAYMCIYIKSCWYIFKVEMNIT